MPSEVFQEMWETIKSQNTWSGEVKNRKKDNTYYWVSSTVIPEYDDEGNFYGYI